MRLILFDDDRHELGPMTDLRAVFEVRTGILTTAARIARITGKEIAAFRVPDRLSRLVEERSGRPVNTLPDDDTFLCVNGRWLDPGDSVSLRPGEALIDPAGGDVVAAALRRADAEVLLTRGEVPDAVQTASAPEGCLVRYPWEILEGLGRTFQIDSHLGRIAEALVPSGGFAVVGDHPVEIHSTARVGPGVVFDAEHGPVSVQENTTIRPGSILCGPCSIGRGSTVIDRACIKGNTVLGPVCKVGGEVGGTIFQGYSNKAHEGHLGDSWVGEWVNFGAGTTNSNLLNTYGEVMMRIEPEKPAQKTGLMYLGAIVGDHVKFAINSRITTGSVIWTGAMIASSTPAPATVERFAWITDVRRQTYRLEKFLHVVRTVMGRRQIVPSEAYLDALRAIHPRT